MCIPYNTKNDRSTIAKCFFNLLLNSGNVLESFMFFGIIFHNIAPLKFGEFIPYFVVLVPGNFTTLPHLKL